MLTEHAHIGLVPANYGLRRYHRPRPVGGWRRLLRPCSIGSSERVELGRHATFRRSAQSPEGGAIITTSRPTSRQRAMTAAAPSCPGSSASAVKHSSPPSTGSHLSRPAPPHAQTGLSPAI